MKLSVVIPVYNEAGSAVDVVARVLECGVPDLEVVVVDDGSTDATGESLAEISQDPRVRVMIHPENRGKGAAVRTAQGHVSGDVVVVQDADLEYNPCEFPKMMRLIETDDADVVYGSRYSGREILVDSFWHYAANRCLTMLSNVCANVHLTDMETCYKMMRADVFRDLRLECDRFGIEPEITAKVARRGCRIYEVPISYRARRYAEGKKITWRDGLAAVWHILRFNLLR